MLTVVPFLPPRAPRSPWLTLSWTATASLRQMLHEADRFVAPVQVDEWRSGIEAAYFLVNTGDHFPCFIVLRRTREKHRQDQQTPNSSFVSTGRCVPRSDGFHSEVTQDLFFCSPSFLTDSILKIGHVLCLPIK